MATGSPSSMLIRILILIYGMPCTVNSLHKVKSQERPSSSPPDNASKPGTAKLRSLPATIVNARVIRLFITMITRQIVLFVRIQDVHSDQRSNSHIHYAVCDRV
ncbi:hypothetical protein M422DRAFT_238854 [Sphaerobolus stellatus SS14]|nr:hypothetical protein M422DRAFT_238854 [Sphaerobolus stellatus SS14]